MSVDTRTHGPSVPATGDERETEGADALAADERKRFSLSPRGRRTALVAAGLVGMLVSVAGFVIVSDAFDSRSEVLVAARDITVGEILSASDFTSDSAVMGGIPHIPYTDEAPFSFDGMVATHDVVAGTPILFDMVIARAAGPVGNQLELLVPLDTSLETTELSIGDTVLLIDRGQEPSLEDSGRPRQVIRSMELRDLDGTSLRLLLTPAEWGEWRQLLRFLGASPLVRKVPLGGDTDTFAEGLNEVWADEWEAAVARLQESRPPPGPLPGPGELEVRLGLDTSLTVTDVRDGDRVLLIDPGAAPEPDDDGRPRSVIMEMTLNNYAAGVMRMFVTPEDWIAWRALPVRLGANPMVLPIPAGTDVDDMRARLDAAWQAEWTGNRQLIQDGTVRNLDEALELSGAQAEAPDQAAGETPDAGETAETAPGGAEGGGVEPSTGETAETAPGDGEAG
ncbi:SAF domain-containing protein [Candidatus Poriferisodalis sp.]|uniref:SAF domain-containing protein n=1 Tax=Candidatus Poriferisodalis sp. TaxID=3101277 RepID=UPI003B01AC4D